MFGDKAAAAGSAFGAKPAGTESGKPSGFATPAFALDAAKTSGSATPPLSFGSIAACGSASPALGFGAAAGSGALKAPAAPSGGMFAPRGAPQSGLGGTPVSQGKPRQLKNDDDDDDDDADDDDDVDDDDDDDDTPVSGFKPPPAGALAGSRQGAMGGAATFAPPKPSGLSTKQDAPLFGSIATPFGSSAPASFGLKLNATPSAPAFGLAAGGGGTGASPFSASTPVFKAVGGSAPFAAVTPAPPAASSPASATKQAGTSPAPSAGTAPPASTSTSARSAAAVSTVVGVTPATTAPVDVDLLARQLGSKLGDALVTRLESSLGRATSEHLGASSPAVQGLTHNSAELREMSAVVRTAASQAQSSSGALTALEPQLSAATRDAAAAARSLEVALTRATEREAAAAEREKGVAAREAAVSAREEHLEKAKEEARKAGEVAVTDAHKAELATLNEQLDATKREVERLSERLAAEEHRTRTLQRALMMRDQEPPDMNTPGPARGATTPAANIRTSVAASGSAARTAVGVGASGGGIFASGASAVRTPRAMATMDALDRFSAPVPNTPFSLAPGSSTPQRPTATFFGLRGV